MSFLVTATSVPPAGSVNIPSVRASSLIAFENFLVGDALAPAAGFPHRLDNVITIGGIADGDGTGDGVRLHRSHQVGAFVQRVDDRRAAGRLGRIDFAASVFDETDFDQLFKALG